MEDENDRKISEEYRRRGGTGRLAEDDSSIGSIAREETIDPPEAKEYWDTMNARASTAAIGTRFFNSSNSSLHQRLQWGYFPLDP